MLDLKLGHLIVSGDSGTIIIWKFNISGSVGPICDPIGAQTSTKEFAFTDIDPTSGPQDHNIRNSQNKYMPYMIDLICCVHVEH